MYKNGDYDLAISDYTNALKLYSEEPLQVRLFLNRADAFFMKAYYDRAIADYTRVITIPNSRSKFEAYYSRAESWSEKGDHDRAIDDYTKTINLNPNYAPAIFNRGNTFHEKGEFARAIEDYSLAIKKEPQNALFHNNYSWLLSTCIDKKFRDGTKALLLAKKAVELHPGESVYLSTLAAAYAESGLFEKAVQAQEKAISLLLQNNKANLKDFFYMQQKSYKAGKPWRENVKRENWMRNYKLRK